MFDGKILLSKLRENDPSHGDIRDGQILGLFPNVRDTVEKTIAMTTTSLNFPFIYLFNGVRFVNEYFYAENLYNSKFP